MRNLRLDLCYDGTRYRGWQRLPGDNNTIQGKLEHVLSRILEESIEVSGSGRTDAGVHALHQIASFHCENTMSAEEMLNKLRQHLPEDIGIYSCREAAPRFHARLNAKRKTYRYRIWNSEDPCVFERRFVAPVHKSLDIQAMQAAGSLLLGEHDFAAFCTRAKMKKSTVREIYAVDVSKRGKEVHIFVTADGFLYNMMRIIAGTLIEVGTGSRSVQSVSDLFSGKRSDSGFLAPAQGLCLMEVEY